MENSGLLVPNKTGTDELFVSYFNIYCEIKNHLYLFINTSLSHKSIRSRLVSQSKNKLFSNSEQRFDATDLKAITFGVILPPNPRGKNSTQSQINPVTLY